MSGLIGLGLIVLASLVHATMQLGTGTLLLLYHASRNKHIKSKTRNLVGSFISGIGIIVFLGVSAACFILIRIFTDDLSKVLFIIAVGILVALAIIIWFFYYRKGEGTELWLPKSVAKFIDGRAKITESNTEAFTLGILTFFAELPFTFILIFLGAAGVLTLPWLYQLLGVVLYTIIAILPLVIMRIAIRSGKTVVDIQRWRVKNKNFLKIIAGVGLIVLALFIIAFKIMV